MTFSQAALSMSAYFDHEYPFLSTNLSEPGGTYTFKGDLTTFPYSSHDGYDWARAAKTKEGTSVLAAASGCAYYKDPKYQCGDKTCIRAYGNAILINHDGAGEGYQTRYYHLQDGSMITTNTDPAQCVQVSKGQQIGKVGHTGNVSPAGEAGSHIHFMVIEDKDKDGNFDDNIPDGLVDPFGWQSQDPDPWEEYQFKDENNEVKWTGNKSYYLWSKAIANLSSEFASNGAFFNLEQYSTDFPAGLTEEPIKIKMEAATVPTPHRNIGFPLLLELLTPSGIPVPLPLPIPFILYVDFSNFDIGNLIPESISIFSSPDGLTWVKEDTTIDWSTKTASASVDHASYFALLGEPADTAPPTTTATLSGEEGQENWFKSNVEVSLAAEDNEGGFGVEYSSYKLDGGEWQEYTGAFLVTTEGKHTVEYFSVDNEENIEEVKVTTFNIDKTTPEAKIMFNPETLDTEIIGIDQNETAIELTEKRWFWFINTDVAKITDKAGNILEIEGFLKLNSKADFLSINRLSYNGAEHKPEKNILSNYYKQNRKTQSLEYLQQSWFNKGNTLLSILYFGHKNESWVYQGPSWQNLEKEVIPGMVLLYIETSSGNINYGYE